VSTTLEQRVATALVADTTSADLTALIAETEAAIIQVDATANAERTKALDPVLSPDAKAAREAMVAAEFDHERLHTLLPRLEQRLQQVEAAEYAARWQLDFDQVAAKRDELASKYAELYPKLTAELVDLFHRAEAVNKEVSRVNGSAPAGEHRRLGEVELAARDLESFNTADPSIAKAVQLPDWTRRVGSNSASTSAMAIESISVRLIPISLSRSFGIAHSWRRRSRISSDRRVLLQRR
jgi:predicted transcriptional regulator